MGCGQSQAQIPQPRRPQGFFQGGFRQNPFMMAPIPPPQVNVSQSNLDDGNRQVLYGIIQRDSEKELAFCLDQWKIKIDSEIQNPGTYWTLMHLCARWNAVKCLSYVLRKYYQEQPSFFVKFINTQTVEGYTPLMLSVIWGAQDCFDLLTNCGGSDLSLRDSRGTDVFQNAFSYRREPMQKALASFKQGNVVIMSVNTNVLQASVNLDAMLVNTEDSSKDVQSSVRNPAMQKQLQVFRIRQQQTLRKNQQELARLAQTHRQEQEKIALERKRIAEQQQKLREDALRKQQEDMDRVKQEWLRRQQEMMQQFQQQQLMQQQQMMQQWQQQQVQQQQRADQQKQMREQQQRQKLLYQQKLLQQQMQQQAALQERKKMEEQALKQKAEEQKRLDEQRKAQEMQAQRKQQEFIEKQKQIQKQKEDELRKIVEEQKKAEEQRILEEQKANEQRMQQQQKSLIQKLQQDDMQRRIAEQRELLKKSLEEQRKKAEQNTGPSQVVVQVNTNTSTTSACPADVKPLYDQVLARKVNFIDDKFPPKLQTIGPDSKLDNDMRSSVWLRPGQIFNSNYELFDGVDPDDIKQGSLGVCYYLSTISSLAEKENRVRRLFPFHNKELGFYVVSLYVNGKPTNIVVDDFMPCFRGTNEPMFTKPNGKQIWVMVLEKAWVKNFGSYLSAEAMSPDTMMEDVDGAPSKGVWIEDSAKEFNNLLNYDNQNYIIVLTSLSDKVPKGIVSGHAYSLLQVYSIKGVKLYKIRNPWGSFEWDGAYSNNSRKWTPQLKQAVQFVDADDGIFFMTPEQLTLGFNYYSVSMVRENYIYSYLEFTSQPLEDLYFSFTIKKKGDVNLRVIQRFDRFMNDPNYSYSPVVFEVGRVTGADTAVFMGQGNDNTVFGDKSVHHHQDGYQTFEPGNYFIRVRMLWKQSMRTAVLVGYASEDIIFSRMDGDEGLRNWKNMLRNVLSKQKKDEVIPGISYVQTWMKGQYIFYAENNTNRNYEFTVKFAPQQFVNCRLGYKRSTDADLKFQLRAKNGSNVGTIEKIELEKECSIGSIGFEVKPI